MGKIDQGARLKGTFIVPAYKEEATIARTLQQLDCLSRSKADIDWEIVVVNDGSPDATFEAATAAAEKIGTPVRILSHRRNAGLGAGMRTGIAASTGDVVLAVDCDLSYSIDDISRLIDTWQASHPHIVIASPYMEGGASVQVPRPLAVRSQAANKFLNFTSYHDVKTLTGMVRAYDGPFIRSLSLKAEGPDVMVEIIYKAQILRARIEEIPATLNWTGLEQRVSRSALTSTTSRLTTYRQLINGYLWRPFWVPLIPALVLGVLAVVLTCLGKLGWQGLAITACVLSMQLMVSALMSLQSKRYFEELYNLGYGLRAVHPVEPTRTPSTEMLVPASEELVVEPGVFDTEAASPPAAEPFQETRFRTDERVDA
ncbi:glycosyltransferase family 2 protein [Luteococcus peritonei]|uniref:Glycosyltransferase family 2 protein n=1 Tax=Luteococcus peritonei TaxID=88874 RepID=A0ABW4RSP8_9ACTN